jgi:hypothetical protein
MPEVEIKFNCPPDAIEALVTRYQQLLTVGKAAPGREGWLVAAKEGSHLPIGPGRAIAPSQLRAATEEVRKDAKLLDAMGLSKNKWTPKNKGGAGNGAQGSGSSSTDKAGRSADNGQTGPGR